MLSGNRPNVASINAPYIPRSENSTTRSSCRDRNRNWVLYRSRYTVNVSRPTTKDDSRLYVSLTRSSSAITRRKSGRFLSSDIPMYAANCGSDSTYTSGSKSRVYAKASSRPEDVIRPLTFHGLGTALVTGIIGLYWPPHRQLQTRKTDCKALRSVGRTRNPMRVGRSDSLALNEGILKRPRSRGDPMWKTKGDYRY